MVTLPDFEPTNPFIKAQQLSNQQPTPQQQAPQPGMQAQPQHTGQPEPMTIGKFTHAAATRNGEYFSHDNKTYHRDKDGKTWLVTGAAMGDVELDREQVAKLEKSREEQALREKAEKDGPIYTDQVPSGVINKDDYPAPEYDNSGKRVDSPFNRLNPATRAAVVTAATKYGASKFLGDGLATAAGVAAGAWYSEQDGKIPELDKK